MSKYKKRTRYFVFLILTIAWMAVIFYFSQQSGDDSQALSDGLLYRVRVILERLFPGGTEDTYSYIVRKCAHITEYLILTILLVLTNKEVIRSKNPDVMDGSFYLRLYGFPFMYAITYSVIDEIHQLFIGGRSGQAVDVLIDAIGMALGIGVMMIAGRISYSRNIKRTTLS